MPNFDIQIANDSEFSNVTESATVDETTYDNTTAVPYGETRYWRVRQDGGAWSTSRSFSSADPSATEDSEAGDIAALEALYSSTAGDSWTTSTNWAASGMSLDPAPYGVTVATIGGELRVTEIDLRSNNLFGTLPEAIGNLRQLTYWNVKQNLLTGSIPSGIENWTGIEYLYFSYKNGNDVDEGRPNFDDHQGYTDESTNTFSGTFPDAWGSWASLKIFQLTGSEITTMFYESMSACINLQWIYASWSYELNQSLPDALFSLPALYQVHINRSKIVGPLPTTVDLPELRVYSIDRSTTLTGPLPDLSGSKKLRHYAARNRHTDTFPSYFFDGTFTSFQTFYLAWNGNASGTGISGTIPDLTAAANNTSLVVFDVVGNKLSGEIPSSITLHTSLIIADFRYNNFTGEVPQTGWDSHTQTRFLAFAGISGFFVGPNTFDPGPAPSEVPSSTDLQYLYYSDCNFTSASSIYGNITPSDSLNTVFLGGNKLTFESMVPISEGTTGANVDFGTQDPFGTGDVVDVASGANFSYTEFEDPLDSTGVTLSLANNSYQWQKISGGTWSDVSGQTSKVLGFTSFASADEGVYRLKVTNSDLPSQTIYSATVTLNETIVE